jgi:hypothetical protein
MQYTPRILGRRKRKAEPVNIPATECVLNGGNAFCTGGECAKCGVLRVYQDFLREERV